MIPEGTQVIVNQSSNVNLKDGQSQWQINTSLTKERYDNGKQVTLHLEGSSFSTIPSGDYTGRQVTSIEFLL